MIFAVAGYTASSKLWDVLLVLSIIFLIVFIVLLITLNPTKNKFYHPYFEDIMFKEYKEAGVLNQIYSTHGETNNYIKRYAIRKSSFDTSVVTNYVGDYNVIDYYIVCYNSRKKPIGVVLVTERKNGKSSRIVALKKNTKTINIIVKSVDGVEINQKVIEPLPISKIRIYSAIVSVMSLCIFYIISRITILFVGTEYIRYFNKTAYNFYAFLAMIAFAFLIYIFTVLRLRKKNSMNRNGGLEYEFY